MDVKDMPSKTFRIWVDDPAKFSSTRINGIHHNFHEHPLLQLDALAVAAKELAPTKQCRYITPGSKQDSAFHHTPSDPEGRGVDEVFRRIEEPGSWIALYNVETLPRYAQLLREVTDSARHLIDREQRGMFSVGGFVFISAPPSVTPFHIDRENNLWLQVHGQKVINVWDHRDRAVVAGKDVDHFVVHGGLENVKLKDGFRERSHEFTTRPGDGVYFPSTSPHMTRSDRDWVRPGDGVSVSIGVVFYTDVTRKAAYVHAWNLFLRKFGLDPTLPSISPMLDGIKRPLGRCAVWFKKTFGDYKPQVGF
ncbi:MAG TPA: cupin domain-containing protein [Steroidobacteraceae bacterium]|jgi:hypothetical protein|nr:cupin domain-containing protein [Steroidobacteraceae bacterium]